MRFFYHTRACQAHACTHTRTQAKTHRSRQASDGQTVMATMASQCVRACVRAKWCSTQSGLVRARPAHTSCAKHKKTRRPFGCAMPRPPPALLRVFVHFSRAHLTTPHKQKMLTHTHDDDGIGFWFYNPPLRGHTHTHSRAGVIRLYTRAYYSNGPH